MEWRRLTCCLGQLRLQTAHLNINLSPFLRILPVLRAKFGKCTHKAIGHRAKLTLMGFEPIQYFGCMDETLQYTIEVTEISRVS